MAANSVDRIDRLVARYARVGVDRKREIAKRRRRRIALVGIGAITMTAVLATATQVDWARLPAVAGAQSGELSKLHKAVTSELERLSSQRQQLEQQQLAYQARSAELSVQLESFALVQAELAAEREVLRSEAEELRLAMAEMDRERETLAAVRATDVAIDQELQALATEREALKQRWQQFASKDDRLNTELSSLKEQRSRLEHEQAQMEQQRRELEAILETAHRRVESQSQQDETPVRDSQMEQLLAYSQPMVADGELGAMRGGVMIGDGMEVSIGVTRITSINGVEQNANTLQVDRLAEGTDVSRANEWNQMIVQNGPGNSISPAVQDALAPGFGTIVQNTLDNQIINSTSIYDISIQDVSSAVRGLSATQAIADSISLQR